MHIQAAAGRWGGRWAGFSLVSQAWVEEGKWDKVDEWTQYSDAKGSQTEAWGSSTGPRMLFL